MSFQNFLDLQRELNELMGVYPDTPETLCYALLEECGEVARELRSRWRWWRWLGKTYEYDRNKVIEELVDVFKFCLVGLIRFGDEQQNAYSAEYWDNPWEAHFINAGYCLSSIPCTFVEGDAEMAMCYFTRACGYLGITKAEISAAYLKKWEQNKVRLGK
jgi:NTP pyrophosphatase (non-canonical NTP hydrolase)